MKRKILLETAVEGFYLPASSINFDYFLGRKFIVVRKQPPCLSRLLDIMFDYAGPVNSLLLAGDKMKLDILVPKYVV